MNLSKIYNQANVEWNITRETDILNFDLNNDGKIDVTEQRNTNDINNEYNILINEYSSYDGYVIVLVDVVNASLEELLARLGISEGDYEEETIDFDIADIVVNENEETVIIGTNGEKQNLGVGNNTVVTDGNGDVIVVNENGETGAVGNDNNDEYSKETPYFVEIEGKNRQYKYNDKIYFVRQKTPATLYLKTTIDSLKFSSPVWKIGSDIIGEGDSISVDLKTLQDKRLYITDTNDSENKFMIRLKIYEKPIAKFLLTTSLHNGEFLFDDAKYSKLKDAEIYLEIRDSIFHKDYAINKNKKYFTSVIGVTLNQEIELKLELNSWNSNDPNFKIKLKTTNNNIKLNGKNSLIIISNNSTIDIQVRDETLNYKIKREYINVYDQSDELIGKIEIYCEDIKTKKLKIIYIRDENGDVSSLDENNIIYNINNKSHNQLFKKWVSETTQVIHIDSLVKIYLKNHSQPTDSRSIVNARSSIKNNRLKIYSLYRDYNNISNITVLNYTPIFLMPYDGYNSSGGLLGGVNWVSDNKKYRYTFVFKVGNENSIFHEQGHDIGLPHTFCFDKASEKHKIDCENCVWPHGATTKNRNLLEKSTKNIMDYWISSDERINFFLYQMLYLKN